MAMYVPCPASRCIFRDALYPRDRSRAVLTFNGRCTTLWSKHTQPQEYCCESSIEFLQIKDLALSGVVLHSSPMLCCRSLGYTELLVIIECIVPVILGAK